MKTYLIPFILAFTVTLSTHGQDMTLDKLKLILAKEATIKKDNENMVIYEFKGSEVYLIADENANRMRIMTAVIEEEKLNKEDFKILMEANFDRALDAKYALTDGILWAVFVHPLEELHAIQAVDAFHQVRSLVLNYGTTYSSTNMIFGGE